MKKLFTISFMMMLMAYSAVMYSQCISPDQSGYFMGAEAVEDQTGWAVDDLNGDSYYWMLYPNDIPELAKSGQRFFYSNSTYYTGLPAEDILYSPCFQLDSGKAYELSYWYRVESSTNENLAIFLMSDQNIDSIIFVFADHNGINNEVYMNDVFKFTINTTANYNIGFYYYSDINSSGVLMDDFSFKQICIDTAKAGEDKIICEGDSVALTAEGTGTFSWSSGQTGKTIYVSPTITTEYLLTYTADASGCSATDNVIVTVNQLPTADIAILGNSTICAGDTTTSLELTFTGVGPWTFIGSDGPGDSAVFSGIDTSVITVPVSSYETKTYTILYLIDETTGCADSINKSATITVNQSPLISVSDISICRNENIYLTSPELPLTCEVSSSDYNYEWISEVSLNGALQKSPGSYYSDYTNEVFTVLYPDSTYTLSGKVFTDSDSDEFGIAYIDWNGNGMFDINEEVELFNGIGNGSEMEFSTTITVPSDAKIGVVRLRVMMKWDGVPGACDSYEYGEIEDYKIEIRGEDLNTYEWTGPNGFVSSESNPYLNNVTIDNAGKYFILATSPLGCINADSLNVTVNDLPIISSFNTTGKVTCSGSSDGFGTIIMVGNNEDYMYQWSNGSTIDNISNLPGGDYTVTAIDINGCLTTDVMSLFEPTYFPEVSNITEVNNTDKSIVLNWDRNTETTSYFARMKKTIEPTWTRYFTINSSDTSILINSLEANTEYVFQIRQFMDSSTYSCMIDYIFTTQEEIVNTCDIASSLIVDNVSTSTAKLNWTNDINATSYMVRWRVKAEPGAWRYYTATAGQSSIVIGNLTSETEYEWQIRKFCVGGFYSDFTNLVGSEFTTITSSFCKKASPISASEINTTQVTLNWTTFDNDSAYIVRWRVKAGPGAWRYFNADYGMNRLTIGLLTANTEYEWQIRTFCNDNSSISDFTTLSAFTTLPGCADVANLSQEANVNYAILKWDTVPNADHYLLRWRQEGNLWMYINITKQAGEQQIGCAVCNEMDKLTSNTIYEWQIRAFCNVEGTEYSNFSAIQQFSTLTAKSLEKTIASKRNINTDFNVYPNPFNENFSIEYNIPQNGNVTIELFDLKGQKISTIANKYETEGNHTITNSLSNNNNSNIYFVRFIFNNEVVIKKIVQIK